LANGYLPSFTGNNGKYLKTNGTNAFWEAITDVAAATITNDGVLFGFTDESILQSTTTYTFNSTIYPYNPQNVLSGDGPAGHVAQTMAQAIINGDIIIGDPIKVTALKISTNVVEEINLGTVSACSGLYNSFTSRWEFSITTTNPNSWNSSGYYNPGAGIYLYTIISGPTSYGDENTQLGYNAGSGLTLGIKNVIIGSRSATNLGNGSNNIIIGQGAQGSAVDISNEITLGNSKHTKTRLFGALAVGGSATGTSGQVLTSNGSGSAPSWTTLSSGTVTSVALSAPTGLTVTGSPVTTSGTLALSYTAGYSIPTTSSQTNWNTAYGWGNHASAGYLTSATAATTYQPLDGDLTAIAALNGTNGFLKKTGTNTWSIDTTSYVSSVAATSPVASSGGATPTISLASGYGDTQNPFASKTANYVLAAPNGTAGAPTFRAIVAADIPTLNQNTTGTAANITATSNSTLTTLSSLSLPGSQVSGNISGNAANVTGTVAIANGGSGQTTAQAAMNAFAGAVTSGSYLRGNGTNVVMSTIQAADVPTLNQNTTGTAANVTGTVAVANGGTGSTTLTANNVLLGNGTSAFQVVAPGTNGNVLTSNGTTWVSSAPSGGGSAATPTALGTVYGKMTTAGASPYLTAVGYNAGNATTGIHNTVFGYNVLNTNVTGTYNTGIGSQALASNTGSRNTAVGATVMRVTTGSENVGIGTEDGSSGYSPLWSNTSGSYNIAVGNGGLGKNTTGANNTAIGHTALYNNTTGSSSTAVGYQALNGYANASGGVTAIGYQAGLNFNAADTYAASTFIGFWAGKTTSTGTDNAFIGTQAGQLNTTGSFNTAVGLAPLQVNTTGSNNTAIGYTALRNNTTASGNTAIGYQAAYSNTTGVENTVVGYQSLYSNTISGYNTSVGYRSLYYYNRTSDSNGENVAFGDYSAYSLTTGQRNTFYGCSAGQGGYGAGAFTTGSYNVSIGYTTGASSGSVSSSIVIAGTYAQVDKGSNTGFINPGGGGVYQGNNSSSWSTTSDRRLKKNIVDNNIGLEKLVQIQVRNFEYRLPEEVEELEEHCAIKKEGVQLGVIAQELQQVLPDCVKQETTGVLSVDPDNLTWYTINAIKQLKAELDAAKAEIAALKGQA
jgi:hypothetical protein